MANEVISTCVRTPTREGGAASGQGHFSATFPELSLGPAAHSAQPVASNEAGPRRANPEVQLSVVRVGSPGRAPLRLSQCASRVENQRSQGRLSGPLALNRNVCFPGHMHSRATSIATALFCQEMTSKPARHLLSGPMFAKPGASGTYLGQWVPGFSYGQS